MSRKIKPLDAHIINQIAAGEVIEGPFSAVKELVENAIDAQASEIRVEIRHGGKSFISVTDNGAGIPGDEIETAFLPHTTSKLRSIEDLQRIHTLGFRGEALASIASVALVEINTRETDAAVGYKAVFQQGRLQSMEETGCPSGTQIQIRDLFHSTPARLKFMKSDGAESSKITDMLTKLALSRPDIAFQYVNNNNIMLTTRRSVDLMQTAMTIFPPEIARGLFWAAEQTYARDDLRIDIKGLIGQPQTTKGNRSYQLFFVNGRTVKSDLMTHAYESAYEGSVMVNRFPVGILYVEISPHILDVNVHPSKTTIKFQEPEWVGETITDFVKQSLQKKSEVLRPVFRETKTVQPEISAAENVPVSEQIELQMDSRISIGKNVTRVTEFTTKHDNKNIVVKEPASAHQYSSHEHSSQTMFLENVLRNRRYQLVGIAFKTYILLESDNNLYLIDQHAAHERVLYDQLHNDVMNASVNIQELFDGQILELTGSEMEWITDNLSVFRKLGFVLEPFGSQAIRLTGVPYHLGLPAQQAFLTDLMDELIGQEWTDSHLPMEKLIRTACRHAVKARDTLSFDEVYSLLDQMTTLAVPLTCPHGRPIVLQLRDYDLEKLFKRV